MRYLLEQLRASRAALVLTILFAAFTVWWVSIYGRGLTDSSENTYFTLSYCVLALYGSIAGWFYARKWGGFQSKLGRAIGFFALGLFAQFVGQVLYNTYIYFLGIELPYPSVGDVSFFASVLFYIIAVVMLAKVSGFKLTLGTYRGKLQAVLIPLAILLVSYWILLDGYEPDWSNIIVTFLDFGFPVGQAVYVSIAILALLISKNILGGVMRNPIMLLIAALIVQYLADFSFSYQASRETWYAGGSNDFMFALAYFLMSVALFSIGSVFYKVQKS